MFWSFNNAVKRGVEQGVDSFLASDRFKTIVRETTKRVWREELAKPENAWFLFVKRIQNALLAANPALTDEQSFVMARDVYRQHLRDEKIEFGDPRFGWTATDARDLAQAYEIDHWEKRP